MSASNSNQPAAKTGTMSRDEKRRFLAKVIDDPRVSIANKLLAIELDSKLAGHFAPVRHVVEAGPRTLEAFHHLIRELIAAMERNAGEPSAENTALSTLNRCN